MNLLGSLEVSRVASASTLQRGMRMLGPDANAKDRKIVSFADTRRARDQVGVFICVIPLVENTAALP